MGPFLEKTVKPTLSKNEPIPIIYFYVLPCWSVQQRAAGFVRHKCPKRYSGVACVIYRNANWEEQHLPLQNFNFMRLWWIGRIFLKVKISGFLLICSKPHICKNSFSPFAMNDEPYFSHDYYRR